MPPVRPTSRLKSLSRLHQVGRVHAPETDMRPVLPHRDLLLRTLAPLRQPSIPTPVEKRAKALKSDEKRPNNRRRRFMSQLVERAKKHVRRGELGGFARVIRDAHAAPKGVEKTVCMRAVAVEGVNAVARRSDGVVEDVMQVLMEGDGIQMLDENGMGMVVDVLVRGRLWRGDLAGAMKGEVLARLFEVRLRRGTYAMMIDRVGMELGLGILHRAVGLGVEPSRGMLHGVLRGCLAEGDGERGQRVVGELLSRGIGVNGETVRMLVRSAGGKESVEGVLRWVMGGGCRLSGKLGGVFVEGFLRFGAVEEAFRVVDLFYERGVGVERWAMEKLVVDCVNMGRVEGALRAWREMRRGWMGGVGLRGKKALWGMVGEGLRGRLGVQEGAVAKVRRYSLGIVDDEEVDMEVLASGVVKDQAAVLHRWARQGRGQQVFEWVEGKLREGDGVDVRLLLPALSGEGASETEARAGLEFFLKHLGLGSVRGKREEVLRRAVDGVWAWIVRVVLERDGDGGADEVAVWAGLAVDANKTKLAEYLGRIVRVGD
eukprot:GFKZ01008007.1.p1 GENE.GFKZ01008007.1~~GFKZ01008007.1.p1  ORF type:complete len:562 (-),score=88.94 GFKZ01008007.1:388-2016(-)